MGGSDWTVGGRLGRSTTELDSSSKDTNLSVVVESSLFDTGSRSWNNSGWSVIASVADASLFSQLGEGSSG